MLCHRLTRAEYRQLGEKAKIAGLSIRKYAREQVLAGVVRKSVPLSVFANPNVKAFTKALTPVTEYDRLMHSLIDMVRQHEKDTGTLKRALRHFLEKEGLSGPKH